MCVGYNGVIPKSVQFTLFCVSENKIITPMSMLFALFCVFENYLHFNYFGVRMTLVSALKHQHTAIASLCRYIDNFLPQVTPASLHFKWTWWKCMRHRKAVISQFLYSRMQCGNATQFRFGGTRNSETYRNSQTYIVYTFIDERNGVIWAQFGSFWWKLLLP